MIYKTLLTILNQEGFNTGNIEERISDFQKNHSKNTIESPDMEFEYWEDILHTDNEKKLSISVHIDEKGANSDTLEVSSVIIHNPQIDYDTDRLIYVPKDRHDCLFVLVANTLNNEVYLRVALNICKDPIQSMRNLVKKYFKACIQLEKEYSELLTKFDLTLSHDTLLISDLPVSRSMSIHFSGKRFGQDLTFHYDFLKDTFEVCGNPALHLEGASTLMIDLPSDSTTRDEFEDWYNQLTKDINHTFKMTDEEYRKIWD